MPRRGRYFGRTNEGRENVKTGIIRTFLATALVLASVHSRFAIAEKYIEVSREGVNNEVTLFDVDSLKVDPATKGVEFKYRSVSDAISGSGKSVLEYTAIAWCRRMSMWVLRVDGVTPGYKFLVREFYKDGKGWVEYPYILVTNFGESSGKLLAAACDAGQPNAMDEFMQPAADTDCLSAKNPFTKASCSTSSEMRGDMALLVRRIEAVGERCGNKAQLKGELASASGGLRYCFGGDKCIRRQLRDMSFAVNKDARELEKWESSGSPQPFPIGMVCSAESELKMREEQKMARNSQQEAVNKTTEAFFACAQKSIAKLDDKRSDAAVIAKVVYRPCSEEFYDALAAKRKRDGIRDGMSDIDELKREFEDKLLEMVLTNRSSAGKGK